MKLFHSYVKGNTTFNGNANINGSWFYTGGNLTRGSSYYLQCNCETYVGGNITINGDLYNRTGELLLSGQGTYNIKGVLCSGGDISTNQGSSGITLSGCMIAENDILIGGSTHTYNEAGSTLSIYSRKGDITLYSQQGGFDLWGIIYAPKGNVNLASGDFDIHGSIISDTITCNPGGLNMTHNDRQLPYSESVKAAVLVE